MQPLIGRREKESLEIPASVHGQGNGDVGYEPGSGTEEITSAPEQLSYPHDLVAQLHAIRVS